MSDATGGPGAAARASFSDDELAAWCERHLGAPPSETLFDAGHLSAVTGLRLVDGREVVVKARAPLDRLAACTDVQRHLHAAGFPCPEPLAGPAPLGPLAANAEVLLPGGAILLRAPDLPRLFAEALTELVRSAPPPDAVGSLAPPPAWVWWDHDQDGVWPWPDDRDVDLNALPEPAWLDDVAGRVRARLARCDLPPVIGHADWESQNLRWSDRRLHVVHDWDSIVALPEPVVVGAAAAVFPASSTSAAATVAETAEFIEVYERARGRGFTSEERELCWAAGLWPMVFNAKKESVDGPGGDVLTALAADASERLQRAGA